MVNSGFAEMMRDMIQDRLGAGYEVDIRNVEKNNGVKLTGLSICGRDSSIAPTLYLESIEESYEKGEISVSDAVESIINTFKKEDCCRDTNFISQILCDAEEIYKRVYPKVINAEKNINLLATVPHFRFLDLAEIFLVKMEINGVIGNVTIKNDLADNLGIDIQRLEKAACENMRKRGIERKPLSSMIIDLMGGSNDLSQEVGEEITGGISMTVVTNKEKYNGACCMIDKEIFADITRETGCDLFVLPSSVHEVIVVPAYGRFEADELKNMVMDVNRSTVNNEDFLSDSVYRFDHITKELLVA